MPKLWIILSLYMYVTAASVWIFQPDLFRLAQISPAEWIQGWTQPFTHRIYEKQMFVFPFNWFVFLKQERTSFIKQRLFRLSIGGGGLDLSTAPGADKIRVLPTSNGKKVPGRKGDGGKTSKINQLILFYWVLNKNFSIFSKGTFEAQKTSRPSVLVYGWMEP